MSQDLQGKRVAILATHGFEYSELTGPRDALRGAGARVEVIAPVKDGAIRGWTGGDWADSVAVDHSLSAANAGDYDGLVLPGGVLNPDTLRTDAAALDFIRAFAAAGKPIAAICHGPWLLIDSGLANGREVTSWPSLRADLGNAGATWRDEPVVVDDGVITSRNPDDVPAFADAFARELVE